MFGNPISKSILALSAALERYVQMRKEELQWLRSHAVTKHDLRELKEQIMSAISDYAAAVNTSYDAIDTALEEVSKAQSGIADDVTYLKETIDKLQTNPGPISAEDQALLTAAQNRTAGLSTKMTAFRDAIKALDEATTRPEVPPAEPA